MKLSILRRIMEIEEGIFRRGRKPRRITPSAISIILHMIRKPNSVTVLLFIQNKNHSQNMLTSSSHAYDPVVVRDNNKENIASFLER